MVVVLPAPFGPRNPVIRPDSTANDSWSTASLSPKRLVRPRASIIDESLLGAGPHARLSQPSLPAEGPLARQPAR